VTIAINLKINDGLVLAADSASTLLGASPMGGAGVVKVYNNANKIFNLHKGLPIGAITWGAGNIGLASISTLAKDLRNRLAGEDRDHHDWHVDPRNYTVREVAERVRAFMFEELYRRAYGSTQEKPPLGFVVAGYSSDATMAEEYSINVDQGECPPPRLLRNKDEVGLTWSGQPEPISRLVMGFSPILPSVLEHQLGVPSDQIPATMAILQQHLGAPLVQPAMPLQDAIDLAKFLVEVAINWTKFFPGAPTVGGPIELAAISKHEGFKWIARKHYYPAALNPPWSPLGTIEGESQ
jgi:hypothetical protein